MLNDLVIIHSKRSAGKAPLKLPLGVPWNTCLRQIVFLNGAEHSLTRSLTVAGQDVYRAHEAYHFLLEVVCGLHSPMVGETEVMGQFRDFSQNAAFPSTPWGHFLRQFTTDLLTDAKRIRHQHLRNLGSQSYGSLARRFLKHLPSITILGAGQLVKEMLPWLTEETEITVVNRSLRSAEALKQEQPRIEIADLDAVDARGPREAGLIIAAPLSAEQIEAWAARQQTRFVRTLDLRGESANDPLLWAREVIDLNAFFALLSEERQRARGLADAAEQEITRLAERQLRQMQCRPFGWEDLYLCA